MSALTACLARAATTCILLRMSPITIIVRENGPLRIEGDDVAQVRLVDHAGNPIPIPGSGKAISLCRCGGSAQKPFCDRTHTKIGFRAAEQARREFDAQAAAQADPQGSVPPAAPAPPATPGGAEPR